MSSISDSDPEQYDASSPPDPGESVPWYLPYYYWPADFHREPLGPWPAWDQPNKLDGHGHSQASYERNARFLLESDGGRPAYEKKHILKVMSSHPNLSPEVKYRAEASVEEPLPGEGPQPPVEGRDYQPDGVKYVFRNQLKRWLQFRMWQESNRHYMAAKQMRRQEVVNCLMRKADAVAQPEPPPEALRKAKSLLKESARQECAKRSAQGLRNPKTGKRWTIKDVEEEQLVSLVSVGHLPKSPPEWSRIANQIFEDEVEGPHYRDMLRMAVLDPDTVGFTFEKPKRDPHGYTGGFRPWGFHYFKVDLEETLRRHAQQNDEILFESGDYRLPLDLVRFKEDTWNQNFISTWVEYVYWECRQLELLQSRLDAAAMSDQLLRIIHPSLRSRLSGESIGHVLTPEAERQRESDLRNKTRHVEDLKKQLAGLIKDKKRRKDNPHIEEALRRNLKTSEKDLEEQKDIQNKLNQYLRGLGARKSELIRALGLAVDRQVKRRNWALGETLEMEGLVRRDEMDPKVLQQIMRVNSYPQEFDITKLVPAAYATRRPEPPEPTKKRKFVDDTPRRKSRRLAGLQPEALPPAQVVPVVVPTAVSGAGGTKGRRRPSKRVRMAHPQR